MGKNVIKLAEQATCIWLESFSNYKLAVQIAEKAPIEATVRLERALQILDSPQNSIDQSIWTNENTCIQSPSFDRLAGLSTVLLAKIFMRTKTQHNSEKAEKTLRSYLQKFDEDNDE